jgi:hypothetical protein
MQKVNIKKQQYRNIYSKIMKTLLFKFSQF